MNSARISFARTLPIVALLLSFLITAIPATMALSHQLHLRAPHDHALRLSLTTAAGHTSHAIQALNLPAFFVELAADEISGSWPHGWTPSFIDLLTWRAIAFPIYCIPFWWLAGLAIDSFRTGQRLRRSTLFGGFVLWAMLCSLLFVFIFSAAQRAAVIFPCLGFALWISLLSVFPGIWIKERLAFKQLQTRAAERLLSGA